ncbi:MAG: flagellar assembly peptidoglycan hydrolase FlgJ [Rubrivivax sp.]|jgi:flagellar protein FlgJ
MAVAPSNTLSADVRSLDSLRFKAGADPKGAAREAAKAFESLFMQELMKSMRASTMATGMFDNEGSKLGVDMLDSQLATRMAGLPGGLSDIIAKQLERQMGLTPGPIPRAESANPAPAPLQSAAQPAPEVRVPQTAAATFVQHHTQAAKSAQQKTGIPAEFMISQAALETGWGRKEIRHADGSPSFNLFGIKAGGNWKGPTAEVWTTEYVGGKPQRVKAQFRAYGSYEESFADYARLIKDSPRYAQVVARGQDATAFAQGLQRAGYATDPAYADKLSRVINTTLRLQRAVV